MIISGLQKMTLLDFPGRVACTVFLPGCNFRCPFCHNSGLLAGEGENITPQALLAFLKKRVGLLDGVCVTGGEPTLQQSLPQLLEDIKALGFAVKLDTNGSRPAVLKDLVSRGLVDYVAMDVKNSPAAYGQATGLAAPDLAALEESLGFLLSGAVDYELRTTVVAELHDENTLTDMGRWLMALSGGKKVKRLFLQKFVDRDGVLVGGLHPHDGGKMAELAARLAPYAETVQVRG